MTIRETLKRKSLPLILAGLIGGCSSVEPQETINLAQITDPSIPTAVRDTYNLVALKRDISKWNTPRFSRVAEFSVGGTNYEITVTKTLDERSLEIKTSSPTHSHVFRDGFEGKPLDGVLDYASLFHEIKKGHFTNSEFRFPGDFQEVYDVACTSISSALSNPKVEITYTSN